MLPIVCVRDASDSKRFSNSSETSLSEYLRMLRLVLIVFIHYIYCQYQRAKLIKKSQKSHIQEENVSPSVLLEAVFCDAICRLSQCKRWPFAWWKTAYWQVSDCQRFIKPPTMVAALRFVRVPNGAAAARAGRNMHNARRQTEWSEDYISRCGTTLLFINLLRCFGLKSFLFWKTFGELFIGK